MRPRALLPAGPPPATTPAYNASRGHTCGQFSVVYLFCGNLGYVSTCLLGTSGNDGPRRAGYNHAGSGCVTGIIMGWSGGPVSALSNAALVGLLSGYLARSEQAVAAPLPCSTARRVAPAARGARASCPVGLQRSALLRPRQALWERALQPLCAFLRAHDRCAACATACATDCACAACPSPAVRDGVLFPRRGAVVLQVGRTRVQERGAIVLGAKRRSTRAARLAAMGAEGAPR